MSDQIHDQAVREVDEAAAKIEEWQREINPLLRRPLDLALQHLRDAQRIVTDIAASVVRQQAED